MNKEEIKQYIPIGKLSKEEVQKLDEILNDKIKKIGLDVLFTHKPQEQIPKTDIKLTEEEIYFLKKIGLIYSPTENTLAWIE